MQSTALITGASRGLGAVLARLLARRHFDLVLNARRRDDLERIADELRGTGVTIITRDGDVADATTRDALIGAARELGGLDVLINNASELGGLSPLSELDLERFERVLRVNVVAQVALTQRAIPLLARRGGLVVNISSDAALGAYPGWGAYGASKAALDLISRTLAAEVKDSGIAVIAVDPGDMRTRMHQEAFPNDDISDRPLPEVTEPFWEWLFERDALAITGERFRAQTEDAPWAVVA